MINFIFLTTILNQNRIKISIITKFRNDITKIAKEGLVVWISPEPNIAKTLVLKQLLIHVKLPL